MALNWLEELVAQLYRLKGYMVVENEDLPLPKTVNRKIRGHSDIDVLAIKKGETLHVECQVWWGPAKADEPHQLHRLCARFYHAPKVLIRRYPFLKRNQAPIRRIFVTGGKPTKSRGRGPWDRLQRFCNAHRIQLKDINEVIDELIAALKYKYPRPYVIGKEEGVTRFLLHLIFEGYLQESK